MGLFEPETPNRGISYSILIQTFARFIMEQLHQEANIPGANPLICKTLNLDRKQTSEEEEDGKQSENDNVPSTIQQLFGLQTLSQSKCGSCQHVVERITYPFVVDMLYHKKVK